MNKISKAIGLALAAFIVSILGIGRMPQLITILVLGMGYIYFVNKSIDENMKTKIITLFLIAFLLHISISLFLYDQTVGTKYYGFSYKGDDYVYGDFGTIVGNLWRQGIFSNLKRLSYYNLVGDNVKVNYYQLYNAAMFYLFGEATGQILLIINCFLHAGIIIPVYLICKSLGLQNKITIFIISLFLFWPSTFYGSLFNFKDPMILFVAFTMLALLTAIRKKISFTDITNISFVFICLLILFCLKAHLFLIFALMLTSYFLLFHQWPYKKISILTLLCLLLAIHLFVKPFLPRVYLQIGNFPMSLCNIRYSSRLSNTAYLTNLLTFTYGRTLLYMPIGCFAALLLPFLLRPCSLSHILANVETITWWFFLPFLLQGIWEAIRTGLKKTFPLLFIFLFWLITLGLISGNMGTMIRQKALIYYIGFIFIGLAIERISLFVKDK